VAVPNELLQSFFERSKLRFGRCLAPGMNCNDRAIQSHSIQNSQTLDLLVRDGHVKALTKKIDKDTGPLIDFNDVGRNQATTFCGFCARHDSEIFKAIDTNVFRADDPEHLFLTSYRAVALKEKVDYICQNPARAGLVTRETDYRWLWRGDVPVL